MVPVPVPARVPEPEPPTSSPRRSINLSAGIAYIRAFVEITKRGAGQRLGEAGIRRLLRVLAYDRKTEDVYRTGWW